MNYEKTTRNKSTEAMAIARSTDPKVIYDQAKADHKAKIAKLRGEIRLQKLLIRQAKTTYKISKLKG